MSPEAGPASLHVAGGHPGLELGGQLSSYQQPLTPATQLNTTATTTTVLDAERVSRSHSALEDVSSNSDSNHADLGLSPSLDLDLTVAAGDAIEAGSSMFPDQTLVEEERDREGEGWSKKHHDQHRKNTPSSSSGSHSHSHSHSNSKGGSGAGSHEGISVNHATPWDPLHTNEGIDEKSAQEGDEGQDVVDSRGKLLFPPEARQVKLFPPPSKRGSHLKLDVKPTSPPLWEQVDPPPDNNLKALEYYSPAASQKFHTMQNAGPRPLIPKSSYYFGPPPPDSAYGTAPTGQIGVHHPREILRVERDYTGGELIQFAPIYPLELEGRLTPTQFLESINSINEILISAHSLRHSFFDNVVTIFSLQISKLFVSTHFEKEMQRLKQLVDDLNGEMYNPVGLNILWPRNVAFLYLEIEYY